MIRRSVPFFTLLALAAATQAAAQVGLLQPSDETAYATKRLPNPLVSETQYQPYSQKSSGRVGFLSTRLGHYETTAALRALSESWNAANEQPLHTPPIESSGLPAQQQWQQANGAEAFIVDAPQPSTIHRFVTITRLVELPLVLIADEGTTSAVPVIHQADDTVQKLLEAVAQAKPAAGAAVAYLVTPAVPENRRQNLIPELLSTGERLGLPPLRSLSLGDLSASSPDPDPTFVLIPAPQDTVVHFRQVRARFPKATILGVGDDPRLLEAVEEGTLNGIVRRDYPALVSAASAALANQKQAPVSVPSVVLWGKRP
jgi:hypothetical protein